MNYPDRGLDAYMLSQYLMEIIALQKIVDANLNTVFIYDDYYLNCDYSELEGDLAHLFAVVGDVDIVALSNLGEHKEGGRHKVLPPVRPVDGAEMFVYGCPYNAGASTFLTPLGARRVLDRIRREGEFSALEEILPYVMYNEPNIYCVRENYRYFRGVEELAGDSISYHLGHLHHQKVAGYIEQYKLMPFGGRDD